MAFMKKNPSRKRRLEGFRKWESEAPRQEKDQTLGAALARLASQLQIEGKLSEQRAVEKWGEIVGEQIAAVSQAVSIKDGVLTVKVVNSSWRQELHYIEGDILSKLNRALREQLVHSIKFR